MNETDHGYYSEVRKLIKVNKFPESSCLSIFYGSIHFDCYPFDE